MKHEMRLTIAYSKIKKKRNLVLISNDTHQRETVSERPIRPPLMTQTCKTQGVELQKLKYPIFLCLTFTNSLTGKNEKSTFHTCHCHELYREEAVVKKKFQLYFEDYDFCEYVKFGAISLQINIL